MNFQAPRGTRDFFPQDMVIRNWNEQRWKGVSRRHGFVEYDGPVFEYLELYRVKSGDEIVSQLFSFEDRGGRELAIRPEMTPTLARMVAARASALARPIKWFSVPRLCRAERPQRGRLREFIQWNIDILGEDGEIADAECLFVAADLFRDIGLSPAQVHLRINSRAVVAALLRHADIPDDRHPAIYAVLDRRDKIPLEAFLEQLRAIGLTDRQQAELTELGSARGPEGLSLIERRLADDEQGREHCRRLRAVFELLAAMGVADYCRYDMSVIRGLAYYTGIVFEGFGAGGLQRAVCGGGRYDRLLSDLGGPPMGGVGFAQSDVVVQDLLTEAGLLPTTAETTDFFVIDADPAVFPGVLQVAASLRERNLATQFSYKRQGVGKQFKQAATANARRVVIVERDYAQTRAVTVKDMATGRQAALPLDQLLARPFGDMPPET